MTRSYADSESAGVSKLLELSRTASPSLVAKSFHTASLELSRAVGRRFWQSQAAELVRFAGERGQLAGGL